MSERPTLLDALVDLAVYAPVGLALTAAEELPELIAKGRSRIEPQFGTARLVGQLVVAEGRRRVLKFSGLGGVARRPRPTDGASSDGAPSEEPGAAPAEGSPTSAAGGMPADEDGSEQAGSRPGATRRSAASAGTGSREEVPEAESLAIPGYDSLSASQVVQRLAGLSPSELSAVGRYEAATRGRRTILARVAQLQGS